MTSDAPRRPRRPASLDAATIDQLPGSVDPAEMAESAHSTAHALISQGRAAVDPQIVQRLVALADVEGLDAIADLWALSPPDTLPGVLWRLYALRAWVVDDSQVVADRYRQGVVVAAVHDVIAGVAAIPNADDVRRLVDQVLTGVFTRDLDVALERASAFCRVVATGTAFDADHLDGLDSIAAARITRSASALLRTADELALAADLWRQGHLE